MSSAEPASLDRPRTLGGVETAASLRHALRAPPANGATLVAPPWGALGAMMAANQRTAARADYDLQGRALVEVARQARAELLTAARQYTSQYRDVPPLAAARNVVLAGHQPQLFHPGVWYKNAVLSRLAAAHDAVAVNLVIDCDTAKGASLRVPGGSLEAPLVETVPYDEPGGEIPFEERAVVSPATLAGFAAHATRVLTPLVPDPLVPAFWPRVLERCRATGNLGACLSQARHQLEGEWGLATLELPQSRVCTFESFGWFTAHLLAHLPRFWDVYNAAVADYRRRYHVRSANHPAPDLASDGDWLEAPFWIWSASDPRRRRLFARQRNGELQLTDRRGWEVALRLSADGDASAAVNLLGELPMRDVRLRTRALLTTLFARLVLGDLFLHGIGGGKYDELTDELFARFFGLEPPGFAVVTGTLRLPTGATPVAAAEIRQADRALRDLEFHPERWLEDGAPSTCSCSPHAWIEEKARYVATVPTRATARARGQAIRELNERMQPLVSPRREAWRAERERLSRQAGAWRVLGSREYAFCLFPEKTLREFLLEIRPGRP